MAFKWYVIQSYSGSEKAVERMIHERAKKSALDNLIQEIVIPVRTVTVLKKGKKVEEAKNVYPGYILAHLDLNDRLWHLIKAVPKVATMVSQSGKPKAISQIEVDNILQRLADDSFAVGREDSYEVGESVRIIDGGPFDGFSGSIENIDSEKKELNILVTILGRSTPVVLGFDQVEKI